MELFLETWIVKAKCLQFFATLSVMGNGVTLIFERPLIREPNQHFFEPFRVCDGRPCITSAWIMPWLRICDSYTEWAWGLDGGSKLWSGFVLRLWGMAVWKRDEEDKALEKGDWTRLVGRHPSNRVEGRRELQSGGEHMIVRRTEAG